MDIGDTSQNHVRVSTQIFTAIAASMGAMGAGTILGFSAPAGPQLVPGNTTALSNGTSHLTLTPMEYSWVSSIPNLAAAISSVVAGAAINRLGRRTSMRLLVLPFVLGWLLVGLADRFSLLLLGRILQGFCVGGVFVAAPTLIGEVTSPHIRGICGASTPLLAASGMLYVYAIGVLISWRWLALASLPFTILFGIGTLIFRESPVFLLGKRRDKEALEALRWYRGSMYDCDKEIVNIKNNVQFNQSTKSSSLQELKQPWNRRALIVSLGLMAGQQLCGVNAILFNANSIFQLTSTQYCREFKCNLLFLTKDIVRLDSPTLVISSLKRMLLMSSSCFMGVALAGVGAYFYCKEKDPEYATNSLSWLPLTGLMVFMVAFAVSYGPIPWVMMGELFSGDVRDLCSSIAACFNWSLSFIVTLTFVPMQEALGAAWTYWVFGIVCLLSLVFCMFLVPETKGRTLEEVAVLMGKPQQQTQLADENSEMDQIKSLLF
ncbi:unnamed protein product, partial [Meganyctiphanes norvegica]